MIIGVCSFTPVSKALAAEQAVRERDGSFAHLDLVLHQLLNEQCDFVPSSLIKDGYHSFSIRPHEKWGSSRLEIVVSECDLLSQRDRDRKYSELQKLMKLGQKPEAEITDKDAQNVLLALENFSHFPEWRFEKTGVKVELVSAEESYPESKQENVDAQRVYNKIVGLLKPY
ncbi:MAG: hypothetical protein QM796_16720 [Chthoniobacteraceae bacterium]